MRTLRPLSLFTYLGLLLLLSGGGGCSSSSYTSGFPSVDMGEPPPDAGMFQPMLTGFGLEVPGGQRGLAVADLDKDSLPDVVVTLPYDGKLAILWSPGAPGPQKTTLITVPGTPYGLTLVDLNHDQVADLAFTDPATGTLNVFFTRSPWVSRDTPFATAQPVSYPLGQGVSVVQAGLLNGDDDPDLAVLNTKDGTVSVLVSAGAAGMYAFTDSKARVFPGLSHYSLSLVPSLIPKAADVLVTSATDDTLTFLRNSGTGSLTVDQTAAGTYATARGPVFVTEVTQPAPASSTVYVAASSGNLLQRWTSGQGQLTARPAVGTAMQPVALAVDDLNLDAAPDVAAVSSDRDELKVLLSAATGAYPESSTLTVSTGQAPVAVAIADLTGN